MVPKFESNLLESIDHGVKMQNFPTQFDWSRSKMVQTDEKIFYFQDGIKIRIEKKWNRLTLVWKCKNFQAILAEMSRIEAEFGSLDQSNQAER